MWKSENKLFTYRGFVRRTNTFEIDWECPLCLEIRDNHATIIWKCKHTVCMSCFNQLNDSQKKKCVVCKSVDDTVPPPPIQITDRMLLLRYLIDILRPNANTFFWIKINDDVHFIERYKRSYARENGKFFITMSNYSSEENIFFNSENLPDFVRQFKHLIRNVSGYIIVQLGFENYDHPDVDEILRIGNQLSLTEGLSNAKVFKI